MTEVQIEGLPKTLKKSQLVHLLRSVIFGKKLKCKFWISNILSLPNSNYMKVSMNISNKADVNAAMCLINNFSYFNGKENFRLSAVVIDENEPNYYDESMAEEIFNKQINRDRSGRHSRKSIWGPSNNGRSRSPHYENESIKLEMEIDLVRRQRMLVEEERKLLLEKKKLQLLREFGPSSVQQLEKYAAKIEKHTLDDIDTLKPKAVVPKASTASDSVPLFVLPCRRVVREMKYIISTINDAADKDRLLKSLRVKLRKRIAELLQGQSFMHSGEIHKLYRQTYPVETDVKIFEQLKIELNIGQKVDEEKAPDVKEIVNNIQEEPEAKLSTDHSNSDNVKNIKVKTDAKSEPNDTDCAALVKEEHLDAATAGQDDTMKTDEQTSAFVIEHITNDINDELDDWLDDDLDNGVQIQGDTPKDVNDSKNDE